jgi:hypothetical protein
MNKKLLCKYIFNKIFTVNKNIIEDCKKEDKFKNHLKYRVLISILLIPFLYIFIFGYISEGLNIFNVFRTILFFIFFRLIAKDMTDFIISIFFYKSSYSLTLKEKRRLKLKRLKKKK